jgi:hypothetical protein
LHLFFSFSQTDVELFPDKLKNNLIPFFNVLVSKERNGGGKVENAYFKSSTSIEWAESSDSYLLLYVADSVLEMDS